MSEQGDTIREFILHHVRRHPSDVAGVAAGRFGVSRQAVSRHVQALVKAKSIKAGGQTRARTYELVPTLKFSAALDVASALEEDAVWRDQIHPRVEDLPRNVYRTCVHGFTEMVNNAIDHARAKRITVGVVRTAADVELRVEDDGVGIFDKIAAALRLADPRQAALELEIVGHALKSSELAKGAPRLRRLRIKERLGRLPFC